MKKHIIKFVVITTLFAPFGALSQIPTEPFLRHFAWTQDISVPGTFSAKAESGEGVRLTAQIRSNGALPRIPDGSTASLYWQTNGMDSAAWWVATASVTALGVVDAVFPASPAGRYVALLSIENDGAKIYAARAILTITASPGPAPNTIMPPVPALDFAKVQIINPESAPFLMSGDLPDFPEPPDLSPFATWQSLDSATNALVYATGQAQHKADEAYLMVQGANNDISNAEQKISLLQDYTYGISQVAQSAQNDANNAQNAVTQLQNERVLARYWQRARTSPPPSFSSGISTVDMFEGSGDALKIFLSQSVSLSGNASVVINPEFPIVIPANDLTRAVPTTFFIHLSVAPGSVGFIQIGPSSSIYPYYGFAGKISVPVSGAVGSGTRYFIQITFFHGTYYSQLVYQQ